MRLVSYRRNGETGVGAIVDEVSAVALSEAAPDLPRNLKQILELEDGLERVRGAVDGRPADFALDDIAFDPVIPDPHAIWALALNFDMHIQETSLTTSAEHPQIFLRMPASQVGHKQAMVCPRPDVAKTYDYEGELAVIMGRGGRYIDEADALGRVAGYACYNEGSVREFQSHNRQFGLGKNFEKSGSFGPWMVTADEFGDPKKHSVTTRLNGVEKQRCGFDEMLFSVEQVIKYLSTGYSLRPGDVIAMGTPGALPPEPGYVAGPQDSDRIPGRTQMKPGDVVDVEISEIGTLSNPIVASD
jgi:2-keto-4-pentenoate hydratase/2-oxohepta-3-ene-1,7-dioic acid hydratase in catechol pathway